ncbi:MAG: hypothetical protein IT500_14875 [Rubrivivax sp.]|nr:hypothetical protein [Rubrivivax sp.]
MTDTALAPFLAHVDWISIPATVHPSWLACNLRVRSANASANTNGQALVLKELPQRCQGWIDPQALIRATSAAANAGLGPATVHADEALGALVQQALPNGSLPLTFARLARSRLGDYLELHRRLMSLNVELPRRAVHETIARLNDELHRLGAPIPQRLLEALDQVPRIVDALRGGPAPRIGWGDGNVGNVMIQPDGSLCMLGGTAAGCMDPLQNVGAVVSELCPFVVAEEFVVDALWHGADRQARARISLYAILEDVRAATWAAYSEQIEGAASGEYRSFVGVRTHKALRRTRAAEFAQLLSAAA